MQPLIQYLADRAGTPPDVILVIGAGNGVALSSLRRLQSKRLILVEAHPEQAEAITRRIDPTRGEEVWRFAVTSSSAADATLQVLNNPLYSSLKVPEGLLKHLPNLHVASEIVVAARALDEVIESLHLDDGGNNLLVLDAPGQVLDLINGASPKDLQSFSTIIVSCGVEPLYSGDGSREDGIAALRALGFDLILDDDDAIYPACAFLLRRDDARVQLQDLREEIRELRTALAAQAEQHKLQVEATDKAHAEALTQARRQAAIELRKPAEDLQAQVNKLIRERDEQAEAVARHRTAADQAFQAATEQQKLAEDRQAQIHKLMQERDEQAEWAAQYKTAADLASQAAAEQRKLAEDRQAQIQKLTQERDEQTKLAAKLKAELDKTAQSAAEQQKLTTGLQEEVRKLAAERDAQTTLAAQHIAELEEITKARAEQRDFAVSLQEQIQALTAERDAQTKLAAQHMDETAKTTKALAEQQKAAAHQIEKLAGERDAQTKLAEQRQGELDASDKVAVEAKASLQSVRNAYSEEKEKVSAKQNEIARLVQQNRQLQAELAEMLRKQDLLRDQLTRSSAQIDLIKSLMLSEQRG